MTGSDLGPTLQTPRLILRPPTIDDFPRWAEFMADPEQARFLGGAQAPAQTWRAMMAVIGAWATTGEAMFSVIERDTGLWLGRIGPLHPYGWPGTEVGWSLHRDSVGKGFALEAAAATMDYAVDRLGWSDVIHCIDPDNLASARTAERLGSVNRGPGRLPEPFADHRVDLWGQTADDWRRNRSRFA